MIRFTHSIGGRSSNFLYRFFCSKKRRLKIIQGTYSWYPLPYSLSIFPCFSSDAIVLQGKWKFLSTIPTQLWNDSPLSPLTYRRPLIRQPHLNSSDFRALLDDAEGPTSEDQLNNQLSRPAAATARKPTNALAHPKHHFPQIVPNVCPSRRGHSTWGGCFRIRSFCLPIRAGRWITSRGRPRIPCTPIPRAPPPGED